MSDINYNLSMEEAAKLPLPDWQKYMYRNFKKKFFGYKPRGGQGRPLAPRTIYHMWYRGKQWTAEHLAFWHFGYGDYKYDTAFQRAEIDHEQRLER